MDHAFDRTLNKGYGWRLRLGMLLPSSNAVAEPEIAGMLPFGVSLHTTRLRLVGSAKEDLLGMAANLSEASELLADARVDKIVFNCTAVSTFDPEMGESLQRQIEEATRIPATTTSAAIVAGLKAISAKKVVLITPYIEEINKREIEFLSHHGIEVVGQTGLGLVDGATMGSIEPGEWYRIVMANRQPDADAYFLSCTAIRVASVIESLESSLGKPVVTSNQAMTWHCLRTSGIQDELRGLGALCASYSDK